MQWLKTHSQDGEGNGNSRDEMLQQMRLKLTDCRDRVEEDISHI